MSNIVLFWNEKAASVLHTVYNKNQELFKSYELGINNAHASK